MTDNVIIYRGKYLQDMTREELIECINYLAQEERRRTEVEAERIRRAYEAAVAHIRAQDLVPPLPPLRNFLRWAVTGVKGREKKHDE